MKYAINIVEDKNCNPEYLVNDEGFTTMSEDDALTFDTLQEANDYINNHLIPYCWHLMPEFMDVVEI